ncbi:hypothetical protein QEH57_08380 [Pelagicoccus sp. SDUM812005]|nr:hypothetical protein [Pelagicoccus sp. SDUM812005]
MVLGYGLWMYGGARRGFYAEYYEVMEFDPILEFSHPVKVEAFLPGIESLALGFMAFVALVAVGAFFERKESSART